MSRPLEGKSVLVTRPAHQSRDLAEPLIALGAAVHYMPAIEIRFDEGVEALDESLRNLSSFDWCVFTSVNGVQATEGRLTALGISPDKVSAKKLAVVGPSTFAAVQTAFRTPDAMPAEFVSGAVAEAMGEVKGQRILLVRANLRRPELAEKLCALGAEIVEVDAYRIVPSEVDELELPDRTPDWITLTSSASARNVEEKLISRGRAAWMREARIACIGPITAETLVGMGYPPAAVAAESTLASLIEAIVRAETREKIHA